MAGQKAYNGVAILSRQKPSLVTIGFGDHKVDEASRFIGAVVNGVFIYNAYFPNGQALGSEKFAYKLEWMKAMSRYFDENLDFSKQAMLVGDFNVAPNDDDVFDPIGWKEHIHCSATERTHLDQIRNKGFIDIQRQLQPKGRCFTWWDYRERSFELDRGLRIDLMFASLPLAMRVREFVVHREERSKERPSDHAPITAIFEQ